MKCLQALFWTGLISVLMIRLSFAWSPADQHDVGLMEQRLFQQTYDKEAPEARVNRLENSVYGTPKAGTPEQRLSALRKVLPAPRQVATAPATPVLTRPVGPMPQATGPQASAQPSASKKADESDYPVVDQIEQKVLGKVFTQDDLTVRVPRLEAKVFGQPMTGDLSNRVDALSGQVLGPTANTAPVASTDTYTSSPQEITVSPEQVAPAVTQMERQVFKQTYPNEPIEGRLSRLETKLFNKTAPPEYTPQDRVERIIAVAGAGGQRPVTTRSTAASIAIQLAPILIMMLPLVI